MTELKCPHCFGGVPYGASVCRGCQAEVEYGTPTTFVIFSIFAAIILACAASIFLPSIIPYRGISTFVLTIVLAIIFARNVFKDRIAFLRPYRTR